MSDNFLRVHGTAIAVDGAGVLLRGPSGAGKSDLALRLIDSGIAMLVADDQTEIRRLNGDPVMTAPPSLQGLLEVRGVGIVAVDTLPASPLRLIVDLVAPDRIERLPEPRTETVLGRPVPAVSLSAFEASAPAKVRAAVRHLARTGLAEAAE
ncbi:MAG: aldolase [Alphaproteobacteria bacterium]